MVQVDVFWAYAIGSGFALAATHQVRRPQEPDPHLLGATLYCAALFAPSGAWLLWGFPNWETMQAGDHSLPAWLVALFAATNTTQGVLGYLVTRRLIRAGRMRWAALQMTAGYFGMFFILVHGWDGTGYQRFFSVDRADFQRWADAPPLAQVREWATSDVAITLYAMGVVLIPTLLIVMGRWHRQGLALAGLTPPRAGAAAGLMLGSVGVALVFAVAASLLVHALGWILGAVAAAVLIWAAVIRSGALTDRTVRALALTY